MTDPVPPNPPIGIRWTIGDVSPRGFEALRLSIWGAWRIFGPDAAYAVCVNCLPLHRVRSLAGPLPPALAWIDAGDLLPPFLKPHLDATIAQGAGWKLAPLRCFPDRFEIALDNDCILWSMPSALRCWLREAHPRRCLIAEDVATCFGQFASLCGPEPSNAGIRGLPPGFNLAAALHCALRQVEAAAGGRPILLRSETDEQGLQAAALGAEHPPLVVSLRDVTVCSPFHPHLPHLGACGAHFVGLNARHIPWNYYDRPADDCMAEHWQRHRAIVYRLVAAPDPAGDELTATAQTLEVPCSAAAPC